MYTNQQIAEYFAMVRASHFPDAQTRLRLAIAQSPVSLYEHYTANDKSLRGFKIPGISINTENLETLECICESGANSANVIGHRIRGIGDRITPTKGIISPSGRVKPTRRGYTDSFEWKK